MDIDDRNPPEQGSQQRFQELTANIQQVLWMIDAQEGKVLYVSPAYETMWGRSCQSLLDNPRSYMEGIHPLDMEMMRSVDAAQYQTGHIDTECRILKPDGSVRWVWIRGYPVKEEGQIVRLVGVIEDITEKRLMAVERHALLERLQLYIKRLPLAYVLFDADFCISDWNPAAERILGYTREEALGKQPNDLNPPSVHQDATKIMERIRAGDMTAHSVNENLTKDGRTIICEWFNTPLLTDDGRFAGLLCLGMDVTERKATEQALKNSQERNAAVLRASPEAVITIDHDGKIVDFNAAAESILGCSHAEAVGKDMSELIIPPQMRERHRQGLARYLATGEGPILNKRLEMPARRADGTEFLCEMTITPIEGEGKPLFTGFMRDVTEQKALQDAQARLTAIVEASAEQMRLLLESTGEGIYGIDMEGRCTFINRAAAVMIGHAQEEIIGRDMHSLIHHHRTDGSLYPMEQCPIHLAMRNQSGVRVHNEVLWREDGTSFAAEYSSFPIWKGEQVQGAVVTFQDVTQAKQLEDQFRQAQKMEAIGSLAGGIAHDFNNLLTIINGYSELIPAQLPANSPVRELVRQIGQAGERAASLTRQLLAFSRKQVLEPRVLNLNAIVTDTERMLRRLIGEDVDVSAVLDPALGRVKADPGQIEQVLINLAVNARDAMPQGGKLTIETANVELAETYTRSHASVRPGRYVMLAVADTGTGMDEATKARIFEPFFTTKEPGKGTGLGLATVFGIVKQSEGHVTVYTESGRGTTFKVYLPLVEERATSSKSTPGLKLSVQGTETILLAEDEPALRAMTRHVLALQGYNVLEASNGEKALRMAEEYRGTIHLLVTDVVMPVLSGRLLAERLTAQRPGIKVLYLSGYTDDAVVRHGVLQADTAFLQKPFTPSALTAKVRDILDQEKMTE